MIITAIKNLFTNDYLTLTPNKKCWALLDIKLKTCYILLHNYTQHNSITKTKLT
jgi:hypothetical protein